MLNKKFYGITLALLMVGILAFGMKPAEASTTVDKAIYIMADGSIVYIDLLGNIEPLPPGGPITTTDNVTYILTDDIVSYAMDYGIVVERDDIILDGQNHALEGCKFFESKGIYLNGRSNVTIKNMNIKDFYYGIYLNSSSYISICGNSITNFDGIYLRESSNNNITGNDITNNVDFGVYLFSNCTDNIISGNSIKNNRCGGICLEGILERLCQNNIITKNDIMNNTISGVKLVSSRYNCIIENNITDNLSFGIHINDSLNNTIYLNRFVNNNPNGTQVSAGGYRNFWDNGTIGNYWSDYKGYDKNGDGIGDTSYEIDEANVDRFPIWTVPPPPSIPIELIVALALVIIVVVGVTVFIVRRRKKT